jgi:hypothetical protein
MGRTDATGRKPTTGLGLQLMKDNRKKKASARKHVQYAGRHVTDVADDGAAPGKLESVVHRNDLDEFLCQALLEERQFAAERMNLVVLDKREDPELDAQLRRLDEERVAEEQHQLFFEPENLPIPRRCERVRLAAPTACMRAGGAGWAEADAERARCADPCGTKAPPRRTSSTAWSERRSLSGAAVSPST